MPDKSARPLNGGQDGRVSWLVIRGARQNNLQNIDVQIPLGRFTCVTGVSGSGKSSLVNDILYEALARDLNGAGTTPGLYDQIEIVTEGAKTQLLGARRPSMGEAHRPPPHTPVLDKIIAIDQTPIGRTPRSNPATYIKVFDEIRDLFAKLPDAKLRGYKPGRFSFNVPAGRGGGGRCEACEGNGSNRIEMDFLADVWVRCPVCEGRRFARETLQIQYKGKSIGDVLRMDVADALPHFENVPRIRTMLQTLHDVGLDYLELGQPSTTLSGGEAQRIKLARELVRKATGRTLYVLDEPTTGLHFEDIRRLLAVLHGFVDAGNTVVVIEHNLDVIKTADWVIDLGPEGGEAGGKIVCEGTPEDVAACSESYTGAALRDVLGGKIEPDTIRPPVSKSAADAENNAPVQGVSDSAFVVVRGARQHNLKDITVAFPRDQMTVCTGVSGSGKTSFAIDTVFTEGYRRYVESLSAYARQFLGQMTKPRVDHVEGLSPAICIEQKAASKSPRSTVGTITEIYDYMRVLWARAGTPHCPHCRIPIGTQTADEIVERVMALEPGAPIVLLAPVSLGDGETYATLFNRLKASGYSRVRIDGEIQPTAQATTLDARRRHRVEVVVDRTVVRTKSRGRIAESVEHALALGNGMLVLVVEPIETVDDEREAALSESTALTMQQETIEESAGSPTTKRDDQPAALPDSTRARHGAAAAAATEFRFSQNRACARCGASFDELSPHQFSFNSPLGWCETCEGLGVQRGAAAATILAKPERSLLDGAIDGWSEIPPESTLGRMLVALCRHLGIAPDAPLSTWTNAQRQFLMFGAGSAAGATADDWISLAPIEPPPHGAKSRRTVTVAPLSEEWAHVVRPTAASRKNAGRGHAPPPHRASVAALSSVRFQWRGFFPAIDAATRNSWEFRHRLRNVITEIPCVACRGGRIRPDAAAVRLGADEVHALAGATIVDVSQMTLAQTAAFFDGLKLSATQRQIAGELLREIRARLQFLLDVGLEYLTLHRAAPTLSGGEAQRIRLASQIGSGLSGVLYVLDEPTIGLHPRDTHRLVDALVKLRDLGNTLLMVEHDRDVIARADRILDFGPRAGRDGGRIVAQGAMDTLLSEVAPAGESDAADEMRTAGESLTAGYLRGALAIPVPSNRRVVPDWTEPVPAEPLGKGSDGKRSGRNSSKTAKSATGRRRFAPLAAARDPQSAMRGPQADVEWLVVRGARQNNLQNIDVPIPLGRFVCITGVSGSGKSSLVNDILWPVLARDLHGANTTPGEHDRIDGMEHIDNIINVDQSPIGTTPSSNPATYTGVFDWIRELFARLPDSKVHGYNGNRFSFNRPGGRCEACEGYGQKRIEMHFMPDVWVECETCRGRRYNPETLEIRFKGRNIADVLEMRVSEALELFENVPRIRRMLGTLADVGLDYVQLGQPAPTLSGGEAQRVKLAAELGKPATGRTLYILDEPTSGLHFDDIRKLLAVIHRLVDLGNSVVVVEHNLDVLKTADWIIDLGPEAGEAGGQIVTAGTPEAILDLNGRGSAASKVQGAEPRATSHTATALRPVLALGPFEHRAVFDASAHAAQEMSIQRAGLGQIGREVKMPWQSDGRRWHLTQRTSRDDKPRRWEPAALEFVEKIVQESGDFEPTNWSERASVEITAPRAETWFLHALTGGEWLVDLYFRAPRGMFESKALNRELGLKTLDERGDLEAYGSEARVDVRRRRDGLDAVAIRVHDRKEIDTPAFRRFVKQAAKAYLGAMGAAESK